MSPSSAQSGFVTSDVMSGLEPMPQYANQRLQQQQHDIFLGMQQLEHQTQQLQVPQRHEQPLNNGYQTNRNRSNPASDDDQTEPSSSANTGENAPAGYTRSDTGATSTFGRLIQSATKVSNNFFDVHSVDAFLFVMFMRSQLISQFFFFFLKHRRYTAIVIEKYQRMKRKL
jgi:hypothetical protein